jgi:hypothetical protein
MTYNDIDIKISYLETTVRELNAWMKGVKFGAELGGEHEFVELDVVNSLACELWNYLELLKKIKNKGGEL